MLSPAELPADTLGEVDAVLAGRPRRVAFAVTATLRIGPHPGGTTLHGVHVQHTFPVLNNGEPRLILPWATRQTDATERVEPELLMHYSGSQFLRFQQKQHRVPLRVQTFHRCALRW
jgi:hypothetical protein